MEKLFGRSKKKFQVDPELMLTVKNVIAKARQEGDIQPTPPSGVEDARNKEVERALQESVCRLLDNWVQNNPNSLVRMPTTQNEVTLMRTGKMNAPAKRAAISHAFTGSASPPLREQATEHAGPEEIFLPRAELRFLLNISPTTNVDRETLDVLLKSLRTFIEQTEQSVNQPLQKAGYKVRQIEKTVHLVIEGARRCSVKILECPSDPGGADEFLGALIQEIREAIDAPEDSLSYTPKIQRSIVLENAISDQESEPVIIIASNNIVEGRYAEAVDKQRIKKELLEPKSKTRANYLNIIGVSDQPTGAGYYICPIKKRTNVAN